MTEKCPNEAEISAFLDGELDEIEKSRVASHIADCQNCQNLLTSYQAIENLIADLPRVETSLEFERAFRNRLDKATQMPFWKKWLQGFFSGWRPVWAAAVAVCLVVGIFMYSRQDDVILNSDEITMVENMEFFQNFEILQHLELLEQWDAMSIMNDRS